MRRYNILIDFNSHGYNEQGNIFKVISLIIKESKHAKITVHRLSR